MQPYQMVKDLRTREQTGDVNRVLDGDIDQFIKAYLMKKAAGALLVPTDDDVE
jgi:peptide chain release factor 2